MTYNESVEWLYKRLPMFSRCGPAALKPGLQNIQRFCEALGNPQVEFKAIHVAGTNGKGSTSHMLASILQEGGFRVGLTTSPHLLRLTERIRLNGTEVPEAFVADFVSRNQDLIESVQASYFEVLIAMAFDFFAQSNLDVAVVETGLGGRLDSTNILQPILSVITNISMDHTDLLGNTLSQIASEKAGIIKPGVPVVIGEKHPETQPVFEEKARKEQAPIHFVDQTAPMHYTTDLIGAYQKLNQRTVLKSVEVLRNLGYDLTEENVTAGFNKVRANTGLRGRWEILGDQPLIVADVAHNEAGLRAVMNQLRALNYRQLHLVMGFVADKKLELILPHLPQKANYYLSSPKIPRALPLQQLKEQFPKDKKPQFFADLHTALAEAFQNALPGDVVFIGGSTFVVAELLECFEVG